MRTTLRLDGANCSSCFNDVLDHLRGAAGVDQVDASIRESRIDIEHRDDVSVEMLVDIVRPYARGIETFASEIRMIPIEPREGTHQCAPRPEPPAADSATPPGG